MKKLFVFIGALALVASCSKSDEFVSNEQGAEPLVLTGYSSTETRTHFGTPDGSQIPYYWSGGDYIWLGSVKSNSIAEDCRQAQFVWNNPPSTIGAFHIFYNMTGSNKTAKVLNEQSADGNLGNDGDFGYAVADEFGIFCLEHKTSYIWFDTKSNEQLPKLTKITVTAAEGLNISGECVFDYKNDLWDNTVTNSSNQIVLNFGEGVELQSANDGVFAAMVTLPAAIGGTELKVEYLFEDGTTYAEVKNPKKDLVMGDTQRISTTIAAADLVKPEPELPYELRTLTFEDADAKFTPYELYNGASINTWSDLVDDMQYGGSLTYTNYMTDVYYWYDEGNTELFHAFETPYWGGGHVISNYVLESYETLPQGYYGWYEVQMSTPLGGNNGSANFAVHNGYSDFFNSQIYDASLKGFEFADGVERVIDHMYVTNTNYVLNSLTFGDGFNSAATDDTYFKIVAFGYNANDEEVGSLEFTLCNGKDNILNKWEKWDLSPLGKVAKIVFNFTASEDQSGSYGLNTPAYFAYDDVAVRFDK